MKIYIGKIEECYYYGVYNLLKMIYPDAEFVSDDINAQISYNFVIEKNYVTVIRNNTTINEDVILDNIPLTLKRIIYKFENASLPFGVLTGIRPSKTIFEHENGLDALKNIYYVNEDKANLAFKCAEKEKQLLRIIPKKSISLYINIPFCPTRCKYCSFTMSNTMKNKELLENYFQALLKDLTATRDILKESGISLFSVYIGGGTPTILGEKELDILTGFIKENFGEIKEFTVEAGRADTVTKEKLSVLYKNGVTRISINPQTLNQSTLDEIGRKHTVKQFYEAYNCAVDTGFKNINTDIIAGLPKESFLDFKYTVDNILKLSPQSFTIHTLCKKRSADMNAEDIIGEEERVSQMLSYVYEKLKDEYEPYYMYRQKNAIGSFENVGFVKDENICMYNIIMMQEIGSVISCGAGGTSKLISYNDKLPFSKLRTDKQVHTYIENIDEIISKKKKFILDALEIM